MEELRLEKKLPAVMRDSFWSCMIDALGEELSLLKTQMSLKKIMYDVDNMTQEQLLEISDLLGVLFNASVDSSIGFLRLETSEIAFKIQFKATAKLYKSFIKSLSKQGELYVYFFKSSSGTIIRSAEDPLLDIETWDYTKPKPYHSSDNFTGFLENALKLDTGLFLDVENAGKLWTLDTVDSQISTNHLAIEYTVLGLISKTNNNVTKDYLMTGDYLDFLKLNIDFARRVKEVIHVGAHVGLIADASGFLDSGVDRVYSMPDIRTNVVTTPQFSLIPSYLSIKYVEFGIGTKTNLPLKAGGGVAPTSLSKKVSRSLVFFDEKKTTTDWVEASAEYQGQKINDFALSDATGYLLDDTYGNAPQIGGTNTVDGTNNLFWGTLPFAPIKRGSVIIKLDHGGHHYSLLDDKKGRLTCDAGFGTLDYETGQYIFSTDFVFTRSQIVGVGGDGSLEHPNLTHVAQTLAKDSSFTTILSNTAHPIYLSYTIGGLVHQVSANSLGVFPTSATLTSGSVDLATGDLDLVFAVPVDNLKVVSVTYSHQRVYPPDNLTKVEIDYYFTIMPIEITEAGLFDDTNTMIAYATFPPFEFSSASFHCNIQFFLKHGTF